MRRNSIVPGNVQLERCSDGHPNQIGYLGDRNPPGMRPYGDDAPHDRYPDHDNIDGRQVQISPAKLDRSKDKVCDKVNRKRKANDPGDFTPPSEIKDNAEGNDDDWIEDLPNQAYRLRLRCPRGFIKRVVPLSPFHRILTLCHRVDYPRSGTARRQFAYLGL